MIHVEHECVCVRVLFTLHARNQPVEINCFEEAGRYGKGGNRWNVKIGNPSVVVCNNITKRYQSETNYKNTFVTNVVMSFSLYTCESVRIKIAYNWKRAWKLIQRLKAHYFERTACLSVKCRVSSDSWQVASDYWQVLSEYWQVASAKWWVTFDNGLESSIKRQMISGKCQVLGAKYLNVSTVAPFQILFEKLRAWMTLDSSHLTLIIRHLLNIPLATYITCHIYHLPRLPHIPLATLFYLSFQCAVCSGANISDQDFLHSRKWYAGFCWDAFYLSAPMLESQLLFLISCIH